MHIGFCEETHWRQGEGEAGTSWRSLCYPGRRCGNLNHHGSSEGGEGWRDPRRGGVSQSEVLLQSGRCSWNAPPGSFQAQDDVAGSSWLGDHSWTHLMGTCQPHSHKGVQGLPGTSSKKQEPGNFYWTKGRIVPAKR